MPGFFDAGVRVGTTPGVIFLRELNDPGGSGEIRFVKNASDRLERNTLAIPEEYTDVPGFVVVLAVLDDRYLDLELGDSPMARGRDSGPQLTPDVLHNLGVVMQNGDGSETWAVLVRNLGGGDTVEPYRWNLGTEAAGLRPGDSPHYNNDWNGDCKVILVDTGDPNVDWSAQTVDLLEPAAGALRVNDRLTFTPRAAVSAHNPGARLDLVVRDMLTFTPQRGTVTFTPASGVDVETHKVAMLVREHATAGKYRGRRWRDRTAEVRELSWTQDAGQVAEAEVELTRRRAPKVIYDTQSPGAFATAVSSQVTGDGDLKLALRTDSGGAYVSQGDLLHVTGVTFTPAAPASGVELDAVSVRSTGGQRYSVWDSEGAVTVFGASGDVGIRARKTTTSDVDDIFEENERGNGTLTFDDGSASGTTVRVDEVDVIEEAAPLVVQLKSGSLSHTALDNYVIAFRHKRTGLVWYGRFAERLFDAQPYRLRMHGPGGIGFYTKEFGQWDLLILDERVAALETETLTYAAGDGDSLFGIPMPAADDADTFCGLLGRWSKSATSGSQSSIQFAVAGDARVVTIGGDEVYLNSVTQQGDNLIIQTGDASGTAADLTDAEHYSVILRHDASGFTVGADLPETGTSPYTVALDSDDAANLRSHFASSAAFTMIFVDESWYGVDGHQLTSSPGDFREVVLQPGLVARSTVSRYFPALGSSQPQVSYAPRARLEPWTLTDGTETRVYVTYRDAFTAKAVQHGDDVRVTFTTPPTVPIVVGDKWLIESGAEPTDGTDPLEALWPVVAVAGDRSWVDLDADVDVPAATAAPTADYFKYGSDFFKFGADFFRFGSPHGAAGAPVAVRRAIDRRAVYGGKWINPEARTDKGGTQAVTAAGVDYSEAADRRRDTGPALLGAPAEESGSFARRLAFDKWTAQGDEGWIDRIDQAVGGSLPDGFNSGVIGGSERTLRQTLDDLAAQAGGTAHWYFDAENALHWGAGIRHSGLVIAPGDYTAVSITQDRDRARTAEIVPTSPFAEVEVTDTDEIARRADIEGGSGIYQRRRRETPDAEIGANAGMRQGEDDLARYGFLQRLRLSMTETDARLTAEKMILLLELRAPMLIDLVVASPAPPAVTVTVVDGRNLYVEPAAASDAMPPSYEAGRRLRFTGVTASDGRDTREITGTGGPRGSLWCAMPEGVTATIGASPAVQLVEPWLVESVEVNLVPGPAYLREWTLSAIRRRDGAETARPQTGWVGQLQALLG